jgi:hypothetical protein
MKSIQVKSFLGLLASVVLLGSGAAFAHDDWDHHHHHHDDDDVLAFLSSETTLTGLMVATTASFDHRHRVLLAAEDDAAAYLAGQEKTALLSLVMDEAHKAAVAKAGPEIAAKITDEDIAFQIIDEVEKLKSSFN